MSVIELRPYQQQFIDAVRNEFAQNHKRVVGVAPCGAGKTIMTGWMIRQALHRNKRSFFFVHRHELIEQTSKTFSALDIPHGIISAAHKMDLNLPVQIASVQTLAARIGAGLFDNLPPPDFLICDECHHILANSYKKILDAFPNAFLLGVTATPQRMGGITLCDVFSSMVQSLSVNELIKLGNLTKFKYFAADVDIDLSKVKITGGDFDNHGLEKIMIDKTITGNIVQHYKELASDKSAICYCVNVNHSKIVADAFLSAGISAAHVDGDTPKGKRSQIVDSFRQGGIKVLCNAELFGEGFDVPRCQAVILARPTQSLTLFIQQAMRPMRPDPDDPNKVAIIIDHVQNGKRHGMPNAPRDWSLEPNEKKKVKCPFCGKMIVKSDLPHDHKDYLKYKDRKICPRCGYIFPKGEGKYFGRRADAKNGVLKEIPVDYDIKKSETEQKIKTRPTTPEELMVIAKAKHYAPYWVAVRALEFANSYEDCLHIAEVCEYKRGWAWYKWQERQADIFAEENISNLKLHNDELFYNREVLI